MRGSECSHIVTPPHSGVEFRHSEEEVAMGTVQSRSGRGGGAELWREPDAGMTGPAPWAGTTGVQLNAIS